MEEGPGMVVEAEAFGAGAVGLRAIGVRIVRCSGRTTTQPSSIEEEGILR